MAGFENPIVDPSSRPQDPSNSRLLNWLTYRLTQTDRPS